MAVLFCFIVLIAGVLVTGLVDAATAIQAANRADTYSAEAARAASIAVGPVPTGGSADAELAVTAARGYLEQAGAVGTVSVLGPGVVEVSVTVTASTPGARDLGQPDPRAHRPAAGRGDPGEGLS